MISKNYILTITLNPAVDKIIKVDRLKVGREYRVSKVFMSAGGKGINVSRALQNLGVLNITTGFFGGPAGEYIKKELDKEKIPCCFNLIHGETRTNLTVIDTATHQITRFLEKGPVVTKEEIDVFVKKFFSLLKGCSCVVFSGRPILGVSEGFYRDLILEAKKQNIKTVLDTSGQALLLGLKAKPFMVKPNLAEAEFILHRRLNTLAKIKRAVRDFLECGIEIVIISLGPRGAVGAQGKEIYFVQPPQGRMVNTVGCGDVLMAGLLYADVQAFSFRDGLLFAVAAGKVNSLGFQPGQIDKGDVERMVKRLKVRKL